MLSGVTALSGLASLRWNWARKCLTSSGMSLGRSRSGGTRIGKTFSR